MDQSGLIEFKIVTTESGALIEFKIVTTESGARKIDNAVSSFTQQPQCIVWLSAFGYQLQVDLDLSLCTDVL